MPGIGLLSAIGRVDQSLKALKYVLRLLHGSAKWRLIDKLSVSNFILVIFMIVWLVDRLRGVLVTPFYQPLFQLFYCLSVFCTGLYTSKSSQLHTP